MSNGGSGNGGTVGKVGAYVDLGLKIFGAVAPVVALLMRQGMRQSGKVRTRASDAPQRPATGHSRSDETADDDAPHAAPTDPRVSKR